VAHTPFLILKKGRAATEKPKQRRNTMTNSKKTKPAAAVKPKAERPVKTLRDANIKADFWRNEGAKGDFFGVTFARTYRTEDGKFHDTRSYSGAELLRLSHMAAKAYDEWVKLTKEAKEQGGSDAIDERQMSEEIPF
jgi:hypothetical protein